MTASLFDRLGGMEGVTIIADAIVERHLVNPLISTRFADTDEAAVKVLVRDFFAAGTGGPDNYQGRDMTAAHVGMNLNEREFCAVIDDALAVLAAREIDAVSTNEVLAILYSFKEAILYK